MKVVVFLVQALLCFALLMWPIQILMSAMIFDAPESKAGIGNVLFMMFVFFYPVIIGALSYFFGWRLFFLPPKYLLALTVVVPACTFVYMGGFQILMSMLKR